jgi:hypothetical protein
MNREEMLREIATHERRILELRKSLPSPLKKIFRFRCLPERSVLVYAADKEQARQRLEERMNQSYPPDQLGTPGWQISSTVVDVMNDITEAAGLLTGSIFRNLSKMEALELLNDLKENDRGKLIPKKMRGEHRSQLEIDRLDFEHQLNRESQVASLQRVPSLS